jgi:hypothetical protein
MKAKLKNLKERLTSGRNSDRVSLLRPCSSMLLFSLDQDDIQRFTAETGRDALGLKELVPGLDPVVE